MEILQTMRAAVAPTAGAAEALAIVQRPVPTPGNGEVLVAVHAAGINRADVLQRMGKYAPPPGVTDILGMELSGTVTAVGPEVTRWKTGDRIMALVPGGGYAEYCAVPAGVVLPIPERLSFTEAAAVPEAFFTVWSNVFGRGRLARGECLLVHGGTSGIGTAAIQLGHAFGARVIATAGSEEKCAACRLLGADTAINYRAEDFVGAVRQATAGCGADVILDIVGGDYVARNYAAAAEDGRIVQIATQAGYRSEIDLRIIMGKRLTHTGSTLRGRDLAFKTRLAGTVESSVLPLLASGRVRAMVDSTFPLADAADAHRRMESSVHIGKIVLTIA